MEISWEQFNELQMNGGDYVEDCGIVEDGRRKMIVHIAAVEMPNPDADFSSLDGEDIDWWFEACEKCLEAAYQQKFQLMVDQWSKEDGK